MISDSNRGSTAKRRPRWWLVGPLMALALVTGACSGDDATSSDSVQEASEPDAGDDGRGISVGDGDEGTSEEFEDGDDAMADDAMADDATAGQAASDREAPETPESDDAASPLGAGGANVTPTAAGLGRQLIFTAFLTVGVDDVATASAQATSIIEELGGFLFGQNTEGGVEARSELTFKVLPDDFNLALQRLGSVGELRNQSVTTDDVTERVVDLESRIEVAELGVARLRAALEGTETLEDYAEVERLLLDRESQLEVMRGQLRTLQDRIDLATITLVLTQERVENGVRVEVTSYPGHDEGRACPGQSSRSVEEGEAVTFCFEIANVGDQTLIDIALTDSVLEIGTDTELIPVFGALDQLAPGQTALVAYETEVERTIRLRTRVVAVPTDGTSSEPSGPSVSSEGQIEVRALPSDEGPGFGDGFGFGVSVLAGLWTAITVTIGVLLPLLILFPLLWLAWLGVRAVRRRLPTSRPPQQSPPPPPAAPPPPPPDAPTPGQVGASGPDS